MSILQRYVLREHIGPFCFGLATIMFVLVMDLLLQVINLILGRGVGVLVVLELFGLNAAWMVALAVPMAILIATLMAFGRLSADNEISALRASGISVYRLGAPVLAVALIVAGLLVVFNDRVLPDSNLRARNLNYAIQRKKPALALKNLEGVFITDIPGYRILIEHVDERRARITGVNIYQLQDGRLPVHVLADRGTLAFSEDGDRLILTLYDGEIYQIDESDPDRDLRTRFEKHAIQISGVGQKLVREGSGRRGDREMTIAMMRDKIRRDRQDMLAIRARMDRIGRTYMQRYLPAQSDSGLTLPEGLGAPDARSSRLLIGATRRALRDLQAEHTHLKSKQEMVNKYLVEIHKKYSVPVACVVFALVGIPLGIMGRRSGRAVAIGMSIGFFLLYWAFLIGGEGLADRLMVSPAVAMWAPNVVIGGAGLVLTLRMVREGTIIHWERLLALLGRGKVGQEELPK